MSAQPYTWADARAEWRAGVDDLRTTEAHKRRIRAYRRRTVRVTLGAWLKLTAAALCGMVAAMLMLWGLGALIAAVHGA